MANSAITAYNPYFESIQFDQITSQTGYHSTQAYDPAFLMHVLTSLDIIKDEDDIKALLSRDIDEIRRHWAWKDFQSLFSTLYEDTFIFSEFIEREKNFQKKVDFINNVIKISPPAPEKIPPPLYVRRVGVFS